VANFLKHVAIPVTDAGVSETAVEHLIQAPYYAMDRYMPGLLAVALGNVDPAKAIEEAKSAPTEAPTEEQGPAEATAGPDASTKPPKSKESEDRERERRRRLFGDEN
jgi:ribosomal protein L12E/L44/L45/RPP1/RPP2